MGWMVVVVVVVVALMLLGRTGSSSPRVGSRQASGAHAPPTSGHGTPSSARHVAAGVGPLVVAAEVLRRAADPNDPDGAFMDGYVSGRYRERWSARETDRTPDEPRRDLLPDGDDDLVDDDLMDYGGHGSADAGWGHVDDSDDSDDSDDW